MPLSFTEVNKLCKKFYNDEGRSVYTTPKSYLEMLALYQLMLQTKRDETDKKIFRLQSGIEKYIILLYVTLCHMVPLDTP